jgi:hypothetical protein
MKSLFSRWHNRPISGRSAEWSQLDSTPHYNNLILCSRQSIYRNLISYVWATSAQTVILLKMEICGFIWEDYIQKFIK